MGGDNHPQMFPGERNPQVRKGVRKEWCEEDPRRAEFVWIQGRKVGVGLHAGG